MKILKTRVKCCHFNNSTIRRNTSRKISLFRSHLQPGNHLEHPLSGRRRLYALLPTLELGYAQTRSRCCHQLGLFQSRHHHLLRLVAPQRANHPLVSPRHHPHPFRHVPLQPYVRNEQRTTLKTKTPTVFFNNERDRCLLLMFYFAHKRHESAVISLYLKIMFLCFF